MSSELFASFGSPSLTTGHSVPCILPLSQYPSGAHGRTSLYSCSWSVSISPLLQFVFCKLSTSHDSNSLKGLVPAALRNKSALTRQLGRAYKKDAFQASFYVWLPELDYKFASLLASFRLANRASLSLALLERQYFTGWFEQDNLKINNKKTPCWVFSCYWLLQLGLNQRHHD